MAKGTPMGRQGEPKGKQRAAKGKPGEAKGTTREGQEKPRGGKPRQDAKMTQGIGFNGRQMALEAESLRVLGHVFWKPLYPAGKNPALSLVRRYVD